ncbi:MAG: flagellar protein FliS [Ignavibacteriales bacterium]|nr:flagellar protein FliS [Ignavibacteriales bacterium]
MNNLASSTTNRRLNLYLTNDIQSASPEQLIMKVYDFAILNCQRHEMIKTNEALQVLVNALNFENEAAKEISLGLLRIYVYCQEQMRKKNFREVQKILTDLRDTWQTALQIKG